MNDEIRLRVLAPNPVACIVRKNHVVAHKDQPLDGLNDLEGDDIVIEGLQDLDGSIKGLSLKLNAVTGGLKDLITHARG